MGDKDEILRARATRDGREILEELIIQTKDLLSLLRGRIDEFNAAQIAQLGTLVAGFFTALDLFQGATVDFLKEGR